MGVGGSNPLTPILPSFNMIPSKTKSKYYIPDFSFSEIEDLYSKHKTVILPVGGLEPFGRTIPVGIIQRVNDYLAHTISNTLKILLLPSLMDAIALRYHLLTLLKTQTHGCGVLQIR